MSNDFNRPLRFALYERESVGAALMLTAPPGNDEPMCGA